MYFFSLIIDTSKLINLSKKPALIKITQVTAFHRMKWQNVRDFQFDFPIDYRFGSFFPRDSASRYRHESSAANSRRHKISRLNRYHVTASLTKLVRTPGFRLINRVTIYGPLNLSPSVVVSSFLIEHASAIARISRIGAAHSISLVIGMRSTLGITYGRNADDRRWKNGQPTTSRSWNYPLICTSMNFGALSSASLK